MSKPPEPGNLHSEQWQAVFERAIERGVSYTELAAALGCDVHDLFHRWSWGVPLTQAHINELNRLLPGIWRELNGVLDRHLAAGQAVPPAAGVVSPAAPRFGPDGVPLALPTGPAGRRKKRRRRAKLEAETA